MKVAGFRFAGVAAGVKKKGGKDVGLIACDAPVAAAAVFIAEAFDTRVSGVDEAERKIGLPVLASIPDIDSFTVKKAEALATSPPLTGSPSTGASLDTRSNRRNSPTPY